MSLLHPWQLTAEKSDDLENGSHCDGENLVVLNSDSNVEDIVAKDFTWKEER